MEALVGTREPFIVNRSRAGKDMDIIRVTQEKKGDTLCSTFQKQK